MPPNIQLHFFSSPLADRHIHNTWIQRLPKKVDESIFAVDSPVNFGWGVHIVEGPNIEKIASVSFLGLIVAFVPTALWWGLKNDIQGATGLGSLLLGAIALATVCFLTSKQS